MKILLALWIIAASAGFTHSFLAERSRRLLCMKEMAEGLKQLGFYISRWQLPLEEAFETLGKEETSVLYGLYERLSESLSDRSTDDLGELWRKESLKYLRSYGLPGVVLEIWCKAFEDMAPLPLEEQRRLALKAEQIEKICGELEEKYRQEKKTSYGGRYLRGADFLSVDVVGGGRWKSA